MASLLGRVLFGRRMAPGALPALLGGGYLTLNTSESRALIGGSVWPLAAALCHHLLAQRAELKLEEGVSTIELGAGPGAVGIYAAALGARVTLSEMRPSRAATIPVSYTADGDLDLPEGQSDCLLELLQLNVEANRSHYLHTPMVCCGGECHTPSCTCSTTHPLHRCTRFATFVRSGSSHVPFSFSMIDLPVSTGPRTRLE